MWNKFVPIALTRTKAGKHLPHPRTMRRVAVSRRIVRKIHDRSTQNSVQVEWVLNHQFLRIQMKDLSTPAAYEAMVFIGFDNASERYVAHTTRQPSVWFPPDA